MNIIYSDYEFFFFSCFFPWKRARFLNMDKTLADVYTRDLITAGILKTVLSMELKRVTKKPLIPTPFPI